MFFFSEFNPIPNQQAVGTLKGNVRDMEYESDSEQEEEEDSNGVAHQPATQQKPTKGGIFSLFK